MPKANINLRVIESIKCSTFKSNAWYSFTILFALFISFYNLGYGSFHPEDEALHVSVIQNMINHNHITVPYDENGPYFNKPPLKMWATIPIIKLLGDFPFSYRLIDAFLGFFTSLLIYKIALYLFSSKRSAFFSVLFFLTTDIVLFDMACAYRSTHARMIMSLFIINAAVQALG